MLLEEFKDSCIKLKPGEIVERFLIERSSFFFDEVEKGKEYEFKKEIARILDVHIRDIVIVGSGKLGFSLKPDEDVDGRMYHFRKFDENRKKKSDLDIAVVSSQVFDNEMKNLYDHTTDYSSLKWTQKKAFSNYFLKGRLAIRYLPPEFLFTKQVRDVQEKFKTLYSREVNLEIYKSWYFFETYHQQNIQNIHITLI